MKLMRRFEINTGRQYTAAGQVIEIALIQIGHYDTVIYFNDRARMINGLIPVYSSARFQTDHDVKTHVMHCYDFGQYTSILKGLHDRSNELVRDDGVLWESSVQQWLETNPKETGYES